MSRFTNLLLKGCLVATFCFSAPSAAFTSVSLTGRLAGATLEHQINLSDPAASGQDTITIRYTVPQIAWVAVGVNPTGFGMINGEVVIGKPDDGTVLKYRMTDQNAGAIAALPDQTLINTSLQQTGGNTVLTFTKILDEAGEYTITADETNQFIAAFGFSNTFGFHQGYAIQPITLDAGTIAAPTTPAPAPTAAPPPTVAPAQEADFKSVQLSGSLSQADFKYRLNRNDGDADGADTITVEFSCPGNVWVGSGVSEFGVMIPGKAVMGFPGSGETPVQVSLEDRNVESVNPLPNQALIDSAITFANDRTTLRYTLPIFSESALDDVNEALEIHADGRTNNFIGACGTSAGPSFHQFFGGFGVVVEDGDEAPGAPVTSPTSPPGVETLELTGDLQGSTLDYQFTFDDPAVGGKDSITVTYTAPVTAWVGVGISETGLMLGSDAVIGIPSTGEVKKYSLNSKATDLSGIVMMPDESQTLANAAITQANGMTTLTYTKILIEDGEIPINRVGENTLIAAHGISNTLGFHATRGSFNLSGKAIERDNSLWKVHGWLAAIAWGLFCPLAILAGLFRKYIPGEGTWFQIHRILQTLVVVLTIASVAVAIAALNKDTPARLSANHFSTDFADGHRTIGLVVLILAIFQVAGGIMRPHLPPKPEASPDDEEGNKGTPAQSGEKSGARKAWEVLHRLIGVGLLALTWYQIKLGIFWYNEFFNGGDSASTLNILYGVIGVLGGLIILGVTLKILMG